jgi:hypothetical protein
MTRYLIALCLPLLACGSPFSETYAPDQPGYFGSPDQYVGLHHDAADPPDAEAEAEAGQDAAQIDAEAGLDVSEPPDASSDAPAEAPCSVVHDDGLGQHWTDCAALATYNDTEAMAACNAWLAANPTPASCYVAANQEVIISTQTFCMKWVYSGGYPGFVQGGGGCLNTVGMWQ